MLYLSEVYNIEVIFDGQSSFKTACLQAEKNIKLLNKHQSLFLPPLPQINVKFRNFSELQENNQNNKNDQQILVDFSNNKMRIILQNKTINIKPSPQMTSKAFLKSILLKNSKASNAIKLLPIMLNNDESEEVLKLLQSQIGKSFLL